MLSPRASGLRADAVALALFAAAALWTVASSAATAGSDPGPTLAVLGAATAGFAGARLLALPAPWLPPLAVVLAGAGLVALAGPAAVWSAAPRGGPFGYSTMTGIFFLQVAYAGAVLAARAPLPLRLLGVAAALAGASVTVATESLTAVACLVLAPLALGLAAWRGRAAVAVLAGTAAAAVVVSTLLAAAYTPAGFREPLGRVVDATLSQRRLEFQHDAVVLTGQHPLLGVGGDRYAAVAPAVRVDPDEPWAHHDLLQQGAEAGLPGLLLALALLGAAYRRLWTDGSRPLPTALAAAALTSLVVQLCVENVAQAPAVVAVTAALVGAVLRRPRASTSGARGRRGPTSGAATTASSR